MLNYVCLKTIFVIFFKKNDHHSLKKIILKIEGCMQKMGTI